MSGGRAGWFPQTTLNDVADINLGWGTETEYGQRTVNQRGRLWQKALSDRGKHRGRCLLESRAGGAEGSTAGGRSL